jgi:hypothetical protein
MIHTKMMSIATDVSDRDGTISFQADEHVYTVKIGTREMKSSAYDKWSPGGFCSASALAASLYDRFDSKATAERLCTPVTGKFWCAPRYKKQMDEYRASGEAMASEWLARQWRELGQRAAAAGTALHAAIERVLESEICSKTPTCEDKAALLDVRFDVFRRQFKHLYPLRTEWKVFDEASGFCGTIDSLFVDSRTGNVCLIDWKRTEKDLTSGVRSYYGKLLRGLDLVDNPHNRYRVQLSVYVHILRSYDIATGESLLFKPVDKVLLVALWPGRDPVITEVVPIASDELINAVSKQRGRLVRKRRGSTTTISLLTPPPVVSQPLDFETPRVSKSSGCKRRRL